MLQYIESQLFALPRLPVATQSLDQIYSSPPARSSTRQSILVPQNTHCDNNDKGLDKYFINKVCDLLPQHSLQISIRS